MSTKPMTSFRLLSSSLLLAAGLAVSGAAAAQTYSRTEVITYYDDEAKWVLGQTASVTCTESIPASNACDGDVVSETTYDPATALPWKTYAFGKLQQTMTYDMTSAVSTGQRGTLKTVSDGRDSDTFNTTTTLTSWNRGIPQLVSFADGNSKSALVDGLGQIREVTDETGAKTCYGYDSMGRLNKITYPSETQAGICDTSTWAATTITFNSGNPAVYGMPAGHWRQTILTGNGRKVLVLDAFWRPVVEQTLDLGNVAGTMREVIKRYDSEGRVAFESYPMNTNGTAVYSDATLKGRKFSYDTLGRVTQVVEDSELGPLTTSTRYLTGFTTEVTNPRGNITTTAYQTYDQPGTDWPVAITHPEGAFTTITRDAFGKPTSLARHDASYSQSLSRRYVYDGNQLLCKTIEPETGSTVMGYDEAGNLTWSAAGLTLTSTTDCEHTAAWNSGRQATRTYDQRNRLSTLSFPNGKGDQTWSYHPDGLPSQVTTNNEGTLAVNTYVHNKRRLLTGESLEQPGWYTWTLGYGYNANGHLVTVQHPGGEIIGYAPNALGQPTQATSSFANYATGVSYHPNGAMKQFTYGNSIVHTLTQNLRGLPDTSRDAYGTTEFLDDGYDYDGNGNVAAISDGQSATARGNRTMTYDGLDRLTSTTSPMFGGTIAYTYDVLDNVSTLVAPANGAAIPARNLRYCYNPSWRLEFIRSGLTAPPATCSDGSATTFLDYDVQGNVWHKNSVEHRFDYGNRLRMVVDREAYRYDAYGRRILAWSAQGLGNILSIYGKDGVLRYQSNGRKATYYNYVYLNGSLVGIRETPAGSSTHTIKYQHTDALGSPVVVTGASRNELERIEYEPYGKRLSGPNQDKPGYTGHVEDAATGLTYMQQRYYDPGIGRMLSVDPVTANRNTGGNFNRYWYANNNPYKFTDPDGRYGRGTGWSNENWRKFNAAQRSSARNLENAAKNLTDAMAAGGETLDQARAGFETTFGLGTGTTENMRQVASTMSMMATALRDNGSGGFIANAMSAAQMTTAYPGQMTAQTPAGVPSDNRNLMLVNINHSALNSPRDLSWIVGHESAHSVGVVGHGVVYGATAYAKGWPVEQAAFQMLRTIDPSAALRNADTIMDYAK